jgi:hypothetical protein
VIESHHLIIVGGSYIGLEFGQMYRRFGSGHRDPSTTKLYDRRGYNPEKAASFFCDVLMVHRRTLCVPRLSVMFRL